MKIPLFEMEQWLIKYRFEVEFNLAESGVRDMTVGRLLKYANRDFDVLSDVVLQDEDTRGTAHLRRLIADSYHRVDPDQIIVTTGTSEALFVLFNTLLSPGDEVIAERPSFQALWQVPTAIGCKVHSLALDREDRFQLNIEKVKDLVNERTRLIIINTPHNPSGMIRDLGGLKKLSEIADSVGAYLLVDEHYRFLPLDYPTPLPSASELSGHNILLTGSITKCFGMIGLRVGWLIGPQHVLAEARNYRDYLTHVLSPVTDRLTRLALGASETILSDTIAMIKKNRSTLEDFIHHHRDRLGWIRPEAGAVAFPWLLNGENAKKFCQKIIEKTNVFLLPGSSFNKPDHFRICMGVENSSFAKAIDRIDSAIANW